MNCFFLSVIHRRAKKVVLGTVELFAVTLCLYVRSIDATVLYIYLQEKLLNYKQKVLF